MHAICFTSIPTLGPRLAHLGARSFGVDVLGA
jgi:hypothetical protein